MNLLNGDRLTATCAVPTPAVVLLAIALGTLFLAYPTEPGYDSTYSLIWGRDLVHGDLPAFETYRAATPHPLSLFIGGLLSLAGDVALRAWIAVALVSLVLLIWGVFRLASISFGPTVAVISALLAATRPDLVTLGLFGMHDVLYLALIVWAVALEASRRRRGGSVWGLLVLAGLLRPEAWLLSAIYALWLFPGTRWRERARHAGLVVLAPAVWLAMDYAITGAPLHSFQHTRDLAEELGKQGSVVDAAIEAGPALARFLKPVELLLSLIGAGLVLRYAPRRGRHVMFLVASGLATYFGLAIAGFSVIPRYLANAAVGGLILAAVALAGWTVFKVGDCVRIVWIAAACLSALAALAFGAWSSNYTDLAAQANRRVSEYHDLAVLLRDPGFRDARRCGPVTVPNHNLVPNVRWRLRADQDQVRARTELPYSGRQTNGVHIVVLGDAVDGDFDPYVAGDSILAQMPGDDWERIATRPSFAAYRSC